ncbi:MAG TPA: hypothetical protein VMI13_04265 [Solirubrobacteraceae bacterium]|nr:hypothetical protein [Solirubrobacteraceae bacterium]
MQGDDRAQVESERVLPAPGDGVGWRGGHGTPPPTEVRVPAPGRLRARLR